ncbi:hypothetical protein Tco_1260339, partial [Tanacetum coccineum]
MLGGWNVQTKARLQFQNEFREDLNRLPEDPMPENGGWHLAPEVRGVRREDGGKQTVVNFDRA